MNSRLVIVLLFVMTSLYTHAQVVVDGELKKWHKITLEITGPQASETGTPNPFFDYKLTGIFTKGDQSFTVPGYFAADGNAAESSASSGNQWRIHFSPPENGTWDYTIRFRQGTDVAIHDNIETGSAVSGLDNLSGSFMVSGTDKSGRDLRGLGRLEYVGEHHLKFAENGFWFLKAGPDSPENFLAYEDFDGQFKSDGQKDNLVKSWSPHIVDWNDGDPTWKNNLGKGIIGAINYLSAKGLNSMSFLTMSAPKGDDRNVYMWTDDDIHDRYDISKLDQWEIVLSHAERKGLYLHFKTSETENEHILDGGALGRTRKLYYREIIARFSHHLALNWNIGEENGDFGDDNQTDAERIACIQYFKDHDPYQNHIVIHTSPGTKDEIYTPLLGNKSELTGASVQTGWGSVHRDTKTWIDRSAAAGDKWVVANDEQGGANIGVPEDNFGGSPNLHNIREKVLWGNIMAGGGGVEYYFGYERPETDLTCEDFRSRDRSWEFCKAALDFFNQYIPFWEMKGDDSKTSKGYCFLKENEAYVIYLPNGGGANVTLGTGSYHVDWYNPLDGGELIAGARSISGGGSKAIGNSPDTKHDWVALVRNENFVHGGNGPIIPAEETDLEIPDGSTGCQWEEQEGYLVIEMEDIIPELNPNWSLQTGHNSLGDGFIRFDGSNSFGSVNPNTIMTYNIKINTPGTYQFLWKTRRGIDRTTGDSENDSWVRINADQFYGISGNKTADSHEHFMKIWIQTDEFSWNSKGEHAGVNSMLVYCVFDEPGEYSIDVAGRSKNHIIDRMAIFQAGKQAIATSDDTSAAEKECTSTGCGPSIAYTSFDDFPNFNIDGFRPAYKDNNNSVLAINAAQYKDEFAAANRMFDGATGSYDIEITTLTEIDGESIYRLKVANKLIGTFQNPETEVDYIREKHTWNNIAIRNGDVIQVEFNSHTNGKIPEGGGTAFARGRWEKLTFIPLCNGEAPQHIFVDSLKLGLEELFLFPGNSQVLNPVVYPDNATNNAITLVSSNPEVVEIIDRTITALQPGVAAITCYSEEDAAINDVMTVVVEEPVAEEQTIPTISHDRSGIIATFASSENQHSPSKTHLKEHSLDGDPLTKWHSEWKPTLAEYPHEVHFDLGEELLLDQIKLLTRDEGINGIIKGYELYVSNDDQNWGTPVKAGALGYSASPTEEELRAIQFIPLDETVSGRYFRIVATEEINGGPWASFAEIFFDVYIQELNLSLNEFTAEVDDTQSLTATLAPIDDQVSFPVTWISTNETVATVDENGLVTCTGGGFARVIASIHGGAVADTCLVSVAAPGITTIGVLTDSLTLFVDSTAAVQAVTIPVDAPVNWSSHMTGVADVDQNGNITAQNEGLAYIIANITGEDMVKDTCVVTVISPDFSIEEETIDLIVGESYVLTTDWNPEDALVSWSSTDADIATAFSSTIVASAPGTVDITGSILNGSFSDQLTVNIIQPSITASIESDTLLVDEQLQLTAIVNPEMEYSWSSSDDAVATVSPDGLVTAVGEGVAIISASSVEGNFNGNTEIRVVLPKVVIEEESITLDINQSAPLTYYAVPVENEISWSTADASIATISTEGLVETKAYGQVFIYASILGGQEVDSVLVLVEEIIIDVTGVTMSQNTMTLEIGDSETLTATVWPQDATNTAVTWTSTNTDVASVSSEGIVTAIAAGSATVSTTTVDGNWVAQSAVTVNGDTDEEIPLSIGDHLTSSILFPNPATGEFSMRGLKSESYHVIITNLSGKECLNGEFLAEQPISVHHLKNGIYIAEIIKNEDSIIVKLIIQ